MTATDPVRDLLDAMRPGARRLLQRVIDHTVTVDIHTAAALWRTGVSTRCSGSGLTGSSTAADGRGRGPNRIRTTGRMSHERAPTFPGGEVMKPSRPTRQRRSQPRHPSPNRGVR